MFASLHLLAAALIGIWLLRALFGDPTRLARANPGRDRRRLDAGGLGRLSSRRATDEAGVRFNGWVDRLPLARRGHPLGIGLSPPERGPERGLAAKNTLASARAPRVYRVLLQLLLRHAELSTQARRPLHGRGHVW